jgi:hypothetical protein
MSQKSELVKKARFRVAYCLTSVDGKVVRQQWLDYFGRSFTYMAACEEAELLRGGIAAPLGGKYFFKVLHEKLMKEAKEN